MEIRGNRFGGSFKVDATDRERRTILDTIGEIDLQGLDRDERRHNPHLDSEVIAAIEEGTEWDRRTLEIVDATLRSPVKKGDAKNLARRAALGLQTKAALEGNPRR
jgi:hypothetical protein